MKPARFSYHKVQTLEEVFALLAEYGDEAKLIAGGQSLAAMMNLRMAQPEHLIDIGALDALAGITIDGDALMIGALTRHADIINSELVQTACPILAEAGSHIGHYAIRQRGTLGGALSHADPAAEWPLMAVLLGAEMEIAGAGAKVRRCDAREFIQSIFTTDLSEDEVLAQIRFPQLEEGEGWSYRSFSRRRGDYYIVAAGCTLSLSGDGRIERLRLALGGMDVTAFRLGDIERTATGAYPDDAWIGRIAAEAAYAGEPLSDQNADAQFRRELATALVVEALTESRERAGGG